MVFHAILHSMNKNNITSTGSNTIYFYAKNLAQTTHNNWISEITIQLTNGTVITNTNKNTYLDISSTSNRLLYNGTSITNIKQSQVLNTTSSLIGFGSWYNWGMPHSNNFPKMIMSITLLNVSTSDISQVTYKGYPGAHPWYWGDIDIYTLKSGNDITTMTASDAQNINKYDFLMAGTNLGN